MKRLTVRQFIEEMGLVSSDEFIDYLGSIVCDGECTAMCESLCTVEPDGTCEHGHPSILLALNMI